MAETHNYTGECVVCTTYVKLEVCDEDETPIYCPLCGSTLDYEVADEDLDIDE
jgi:Zn finger protein HypA/HybF involved in hydrogenase expression